MGCHSGAGSKAGAKNSIKEDFTVKLDTTKIGANFDKLPGYLKTNIEKNITPSPALIDMVKGKIDANISDEWTPGLRGIKEKRKVITEFKNGKFIYTVKNGNKILLKNGTIEQAANHVAMFYNKYI